MPRHFIFGILSFIMAFFGGLVFAKVSIGAFIDGVSPKAGVPEGSFAATILFLWLGLYLMRRGLRHESTETSSEKKAAKNSANSAA